MAASISLQLKQALEKVDQLTAQVTQYQSEHEGLSAKAAELKAAHERIGALEGEIAAHKQRDEELSHDLATARVEIDRLKAEAKTAAETAAVINAEIGVPPVDADASAKPNAAASLDDLMAEYGELLKTDTRAAGQFYNDKLAPALRKKD
jgi:chromosome segregation ATPase